MKIAVFGTGAIGGYIGGRLARAGNEVAFIARGAHLDAIRARGLTLREVTNETIHEEFVVHAPATDRPADIGPVDFVLVGVKAYDTDAAGAQAGPLMSDNAAIVTIQNGLDAPERLASRYGAERVIAGTTTYTATIVAPGIIHRFPHANHVAVAEFTRTATPRLRAFVDALTDAGVRGTLSEDPMGILWDKFLWIGPIAGITAVARSTYGELFTHPPTHALYLACIDELVALAAAEGTPIAPDVIARRKGAMMNNTVVIKSSLQRDFEKGRPQTEIEELLGTVVRRGARAGVPVPHFETLYATLSLAPGIGYHYAP
jgi:2-dehydropantoate 2-reductase